MSIPPLTPPPAPPPGAMPLDGGEPSLAQVLPPAVLQQLLAALPPDIQAAFPTMPVDQQNAALLAAAEQLGIIPPVNAAGPEMGQPPPQGAPIAAPAPPSPLNQGGGNAGIGGPLQPPVALAGGAGDVPGGLLRPMAGAPGVAPPPQTAAVSPPAPQVDPPLPPVPKSPQDWEPEDIRDLKARSQWQTAPTHAELVALADDALNDTFWQERNDACYDQAWCYYRSRKWLKINGQAMSHLQGDLLYMLSTPAKQLDRIVARVKPDSAHLQFNLDPRAEQDAWKQAQQAVENWSRDMWERHITHWWDHISQFGEDTDLARKVAFLAALHGSVGWSLRPDLRRRKHGKGRDLNADYPLVLDLIPLHELYKLGDCTLRIQRVTLREARRMSAEVRKRWPAKRETGGGWSPTNDHGCRLIGFSDAEGLWYCQAFDINPPEGKDLEGAGALWLVPPSKPINYGFCYYQVPPGWQATGDNALPDARQAAENYGRNFARGALFVNLEDFANQDYMASGALSTYAYNRDPGGVDIIDIELRTQTDQGLPPEFSTAMGAKNTRFKGEGYQFVPKNFADSASDNFAISMAFGQTADTFPAALGGGGNAQSGYDRRQMVENAQLLHVEELRTFVANMVAAITRRSLELLYRLGDGQGKVFSTLPYRITKGGMGEGELDAKAIGKAGVSVKVDYFEEDLENDLRKNQIVIPRVDKNLISREYARERLGIPEPDKEETRINEEMALAHPALKEAQAHWALASERNPMLPFFEAALARVKQPQPGEGGQPPQMPSMPGVPQGGMPPAEAGLPPGMSLPPGMGMVGA